ncbi:MAG: hypothetical protein RL347_504 [Actinomycetota bacterium]
MQAHLACVSVDRDVRRSPVGKGVGEEARSTANIEKQGPVERMKTLHVTRRVGGKFAVEPVRIALLDEEGTEQPYRSSPRGSMLTGRGGDGHLPTLPQRARRTRDSRTTYREHVHIVVLNWRDTANPEGGGSEVYVEELARRWAAFGHRVTLVCASHPHAPEAEKRGGVHIIRRGSKLTVYSKARSMLRRGELGDVDVVVDTQNGIPFFARWASPAPTVILVHHVHREQWPVVYDPIRAKIGWFVESVVAPRAFRQCRYVAVSEATRTELVAHGVRAEAITVVHNGTAPLPDLGVQQDPSPRILVLGRLVPHKRIEHVIEAAARLRGTHPGLSVAIVGDGWWADELRDAARRAGVLDIVEFTGHVDEDEKARQVARAWVLALPSLKEGWGLVVMEAASCGVPAIAYADAGGVGESIVDGETGILVRGGPDEFTSALDAVLSDHNLRSRLGVAAQRRSRDFSWDASAMAFEAVLRASAERRGR